MPTQQRILSTLFWRRSASKARLLPQAGHNDEGLAAAAIKDANYTSATRGLFIDTKGLSAEQMATMKDSVKAGTAGVQKQIFFLE